MGPALVVVSGLPAAGKTTLSTRLGRDLPAPVVRRDDIRRRLAESLGLGTTDPGLPAAASAMTMVMVEAVLDSDGVVVLDGNFNTEQHMAPVRALVERRGIAAVEVCVWGDPGVLRRRFVARSDPPLTPDLERYFDQVLHRPHESVLDDGEHEVVHLDTTDVSAVDRAYVDLLDRINDALAW